VPRFAKKSYPVMLVLYDDETGQPLRNKEGRCVEAKIGEPGIFIGKISAHHPVRSFAGYADKKASEKKILRNVFREGDSYFNSNDLLVSDIYGYFYFKDRTGDTFRFRGENVATTECESIIMKVAGLNDCVVYGVEVPGVEGKAGMAAIVDVEGKIDLANLTAGILENLPGYARPVFIRLLSELPMTGTFKPKKRDLQLEGYDITKVKDPVYVLRSDGNYHRLTEKDYDDIRVGRAGL
jgi:solute carrier family 27 fatty acid transporter 1/4